MAIKVNIPNGQNTATVAGLYQWDYGQVLEIESTDLGNMIGEVHFACSSMSEAIVVSCNFTDGVGTVTIPDECLEQSSTISAWIYEIAGTQGRTRKVVTIPVTARTRPSAGRDIPTEISDQYTQLITEVNEAINKLENGQVSVKKAETATKADSATTAGNASTANYAVKAGSANLLQNDGVSTEYSGTIAQGGIIAFKLHRTEYTVQVIAEVISSTPSYSPIFYDEDNLGTIYPMRLAFTDSGTNSNFVVAIHAYKDGAWSALSSKEYTASIYYKHLVKYPVG